MLVREPLADIPGANFSKPFFNKRIFFQTWAAFLGQSVSSQTAELGGGGGGPIPFTPKPMTNPI